MLNGILKENIRYIPEEVERDKKVAIYFCVSTTRNSQEASLEAQIEGIKQIIENNPRWKLFKIYTDKESGGNTSRLEVHIMVFKCYENLINIILVKHISHLSRNTVDLLGVVNRLITLGVEIMFHQENNRIS